MSSHKRKHCEMMTNFFDSKAHLSSPSILKSMCVAMLNVCMFVDISIHESGIRLEYRDVSNEDRVFVYRSELQLFSIVNKENLKPMRVHLKTLCNALREIATSHCRMCVILHPDSILLHWEDTRHRTESTWKIDAEPTYSIPFDIEPTELPCDSATATLCFDAYKLIEFCKTASSLKAGHITIQIKDGVSLSFHGRSGSLMKQFSAKRVEDPSSTAQKNEQIRCSLHTEDILRFLKRVPKEKIVTVQFEKDPKDRRYAHISYNNGGGKGNSTTAVVNSL